jgi:electron transport complex protein RnfB
VQTVLIGVSILAGLSIVLAAIIALCFLKLRVYEDPRIDEVANRLPGANCGACGFPGCRGLAEQIVLRRAKPAACTVADDDAREDIANYMGVDAGAAVKRVARLLCAGGDDVAPRRAAYVGVESCAAALAVSGGGKACAWGCLGHADCAVACTFDAIQMGPTGLPHVDVQACTACGDCVTACPQGLFTVLPLDAHLIVQCRSLLEGDAALEACAVACNACGKCVIDAAPGLVQLHMGRIAVVDYNRIELQDRKALQRCPTGAIAWVEGAQFATAEPQVLAGVR